MSSNPQKLPRKRPTDSDIISDEDEAVEHDRSDDFKIKTLDEILQEKRRRTENDNSIKAEGQTSGKSSQSASPVVTSRRDSKGSSKHDSPVEGEVIYQLSPEQISLSSGSPGGTPSKVKHPLSHDGDMVIRAKRGRKATEEEEGEIISDHSDTEGKKVEKQRRSSAAAVDENFTNSKQQVTEVSEAKTSKDPIEEGDNSEETTEGEDDVETQAATKRVRKEAKEEVVEKEKESHSEAEESSSEESEDDDDDNDEEEEEEDDDDDDDDDDEEMEVEKNNYKDYMKQKEGEMKPARYEEQAKDNAHQDEKESSSEEEETSKESSDEEESESESETSDESEKEKMEIKEQKVSVPKTNQKEDVMESEDLHKELQQLNKRHKEKDERYKHKTYPEQQQLEKRIDRRREQRSVDYRTERKEKVYEKEKRSQNSRSDKSYFQSDSKSRPHEKRGHSGNKISVQEKESWSKHHKSSASSKETVKYENLRQREKHGEVLREKEKKASRKDTGKHSPPMNNRVETKIKARKDSSRSNRKDEASGKRSHEKKTSGQSSVSRKTGQDESASLVLTEQERRQFTNEVVDLESEDSSVEDDKHFDSGMKRNEHSPEEVYNEDEEEGEIKLPAYYPAVRGCRNVEEFQWLNRIEEGTYGVVYRAKDKKTGDIVALKKLKMEREKEGFPITSLREINTLLKGQHPNIVTVREIVVGSNMDKIYIVMDYVEHDLKVLMEHMTEGFTIGEVKTLMIQLLRAVSHLHDNWILHRDLKASNLLLSNKGILKVGDFGLAREYGTPLKNYTPIVVTLWYRAPELLLGTKMYSTPIDLWSVGCIFAELLTMKPLFPGKSEIDQINRIFKELGTPSDTIWPGPPSYSELPAVQKMTFVDYPYNSLRNRFGAFLTDKGFDLLNRFLTYDPGKRITAEEALKHDYLFSETPKPVDPSMFPTWPAKSEMMKRPKKKEYEHSPQAPQGGAMFAKLADEGDSGSGSQGTGFHMPTSQKGSAAVVGFKLKF